MRMTMKGWTVALFVLIVLAGALLGCGGGTPPAPSPEPGPDLLIETGGDVSLKREGWADYAPVSLGTKVSRGDLVRPDGGQEIKILCADLSLHTLERLGGIPCRADEPVLLYDGAHLLAPMGEPEELPYLLYPRNTYVLDDRPLLRWHETGATGYTVAIVEGGKNLWEQTGVEGTEIRYPDDAPALESGVDYLLSVTDEDTGLNSVEEKVKGLGFRVLSSEARAAVEARRAEILDLPIEDPARRFVLAVYYSGMRLRGDALTLLDEVEADLEVPPVHLWRGHLLAAMQLADEAKSAYQTALTVAQETGDRESQAVAQAGLWRVTKDQAWLEAAIQGYDALGDQIQADALRREGRP